MLQDSMRQFEDEVVGTHTVLKRCASAFARKTWVLDADILLAHLLSGGSYL